MSKYKKVKLPKHLIFVDTNVLWYKDKALVVNPSFESFLKEFANEISIQVLIPEIVKEELVFQQTMDALNAHKRISEDLEIISTITKILRKNKLSKDKIREEVNGRFLAWLRTNNVNIVDTPISSIDWAKLCDDAVWRRPPFSQDRSKEKGFRDAIILETIYFLIKNYYDQKDIFVLLCKDELLLDAVNERIVSSFNFKCYREISEFSSYLKLTREKLKEDFIREISKRAKKKFYDENDQQSLYFKESIRDKISKKFASDLENPDLTISLLQMLITNPKEAKKWSPIDKSEWWISNPEFKHKSNANIYHWSSIITVLRTYKRLPDLNINVSQQSLGTTFESLYEIMSTRVSMIKFEIKWESKVFSDGRFLNTKIDSIDKIKKELLMLDDPEIKSFKSN